MADDSETPVVVSEFVDRMIECRNCHQPFPLSAADQDFFKSKGFENPVRCKECRTARKAQAENHQGNGNYNSNQAPNGRFSQPGSLFILWCIVVCVVLVNIIACIVIWHNLNDNKLTNYIIIILLALTFIDGHVIKIIGL